MRLRTLLTGLHLVAVLATPYGVWMPVAYADESPEAEEQEEREVALQDRVPPAPVGANKEAAPPAEERQGLLEIFPHLYGAVELRHWTEREMSRDHGPGRLTLGSKLFDSRYAVNDQPFLAIRPTLGSTFYDGALDTAFTYQFQNNIGDSRIQKTDAFNFTIWNVFAGKFNPDSPWSLGPSAFTDFFSGDNNGSGFAYSDIGLFGEANYQFPVPSGDLSLRGYLNPTVEFNSPSHNSTVKAPGLGEGDVGADGAEGSSSLGLTGNGPTRDPNGNITVPPRNPVGLAYYGVGVTYLPHALAHFSVMVGLDVIQTWRPIYAVTETTAGPSYKLDHYSVQACTFNRLTLTYDINERLSLSNMTRHYVGGFYQFGIDSEHPEQTQEIGKIAWENRLSLTVHLF